MNDPRKGADAEPTTHFGYQNVPESQKAKRSPRYSTLWQPSTT